MVLWKDAFEKINIELDLTKKKRQTLDDLFNTGRISQSTYDCLCKDLDEDINQIELRRKSLVERMSSKLNELEKQLLTLEFFLANSEMANAAGEINSELYVQESNALALGMEATKQELNWIKEVIIQLVPKENMPIATAPSTVECAEATTETAVENAPEVASSAPIEAPVEVTHVPGETTIEQPGQAVVEATTETHLESTTTEPSSEKEGQPPFRDEGENQSTQEEKKEE